MQALCRSAMALLSSSRCEDVHVKPSQLRGKTQHLYCLASPVQGMLGPVVLFRMGALQDMPHTTM